MSTAPLLRGQETPNSAQRAAPAEEAGMLMRAWLWLNTVLRPDRGWLALIFSLAVSALPAYILRANQWIRLADSMWLIVTSALAGVVVVWCFAGWRQLVLPARWRALQIVVIGAAVLASGALIVSLLTVRWLPSPASIWLALTTGSTTEMLTHMQLALDRFVTRATLWQMGGAGGGDELIVATALALALYCIGALTAALSRAGKAGMGVALPALLPSAMIALGGGEGRYLFLFGLALALALSIALDNSRLIERWGERRLDFNNDLFVDRWGNALAVGVGALLLAALLSAISLTSISEFFSRIISPVSEQIESASVRAFPEVTFADRTGTGSSGEGSGRTTGLPNEFLLGAAPAVTSERILQLRTSDAAAAINEEIDAPRAPYLFTNAFVEYTGLGWEATPIADRVVLEPNQRRELATMGNRRLLAQSIVRISEPGNAPFSSELLEMGASAVLDVDGAGEAIRLRTSARNYTLLSAPLALSSGELSALPAFDALDNPLPEEFAPYLALPESVTERTRTLGASLVAGIDSPYAQASAIEEYLRTFAYDLTIGSPPDDVTDITDYFLFDLQRGYCDYFATAFVVLARSVGLPARFVAGYAPGDWYPQDRAWLVTAADSHAWPEVYISGPGWVQFEPTSGLSPLARVGGVTSYAAISAPLPSNEAINEESVPFAWNPQMFFWLLPLALTIWALWAAVQSWLRRREDPWQGLEKWGARRGRAREIWETPSEYGVVLAGIMQGSKQRNPEIVNTALRESAALVEAEATRSFAPIAERAAAIDAMRAHWLRLRDLLPRLR